MKATTPLRSRRCRAACPARRDPEPRDRHPLREASLTAGTVVIAVLASALLLGCATPNAASPAPPIVEASTLGAQSAATTWPTARWWSRYGDAALERVVDQALADQPSLHVVQTRVRAAEAAVRSADAARDPHGTLSADATFQRFNENGIYPPPLAGSTRWSADLRAGVDWELDLFGRQRAALDAAIGRWRAAQADAQAARVLLAANVATAYFDLARLIEAHAVSSQALQQREQVVEIVRLRMGAGLDTQVDLKQAEGLVAQSKVQVETLGEAIDRSRHALAELAGAGPHAFDTLAPALSPIVSFPVPASLPADLLGRRADLVAQRWRVQATARDSDVARAQFYPNVNLSAFVGLSSLGLNRLLDPASLLYGVGPALHLPLFQTDGLQANLDAHRAEADAAIEAYNGALQRALREVADEVSGLRSIERQQHAQRDATAAANAAYDLAVQRYRAGLGNFLVVLAAQTNVLAQRLADTDLKARHLSNEVALVRALGGGFDAEGGWPQATAAR
ncbi:MAG TPA: efflux transporter outer membrane subunit [Burkholderiaceae bacterium]|nr:efflux transporter outer membrane subunit [Burkholderiaceae bacterium]